MSNKLPNHNLYADGEVLAFAEGNAVLKRDRLRLPDDTAGQYHTVKAKDELDRLAWVYYRNQVENPARFWWVIADVNNIINPLDLSGLVGEELFIPDILEVEILR